MATLKKTYPTTFEEAPGDARRDAGRFHVTAPRATSVPLATSPPPVDPSRVTPGYRTRASAGAAPRSAPSLFGVRSTAKVPSSFSSLPRAPAPRPRSPPVPVQVFSNRSRSASTSSRQSTTTRARAGRTGSSRGRTGSSRGRAGSSRGLPRGAASSRTLFFSTPSSSSTPFFFGRFPLGRFPLGRFPLGRFPLGRFPPRP